MKTPTEVAYAAQADREFIRSPFFRAPAIARGDGGPVVFDRIGGQTVRPRACDTACRADWSIDTRLNSLNSDGTPHARCTRSRSMGIRASSEDNRFECLGGPVSLPERQRLSAVLRTGTACGPRSSFASFFSDRFS